VRELLYEAANHYKRGRALAEEGDAEGALEAYAAALRDLHAVAPQRMRDVLLAQVHLSRYRVALQADPEGALEDLRLGYSYARTTRESAIESLAQQLWQAHLAR
jgi:tetratricopeptide (TPR) repeat protein